MAALANGTFGHVLDYDDCLDFPHVGLGHPSTAILPAVLALGERLDISGRKAIEAYCIGIEAYAKIGLLCKDAFRADKGWEWTGVLGVMGATAAAAKLLELDEAQTTTALGIAASMACGLTRNFGSMAGHLHAGNAARNGIESTALAKKGFTASNDIVEITSGFYNLFTGHASAVDDEEMSEQIAALGNPWNLVDPGLMHKAFPCAHISHFGVDAALGLRNDSTIHWQEIERIEFGIPSLLQRVVAYPEPRTGIEAKFSLGYCLCRALIYGCIRIDDFRDENFRDADIFQLMDKIDYRIIEPKTDRLPFGYQQVILSMSDGSTFSHKVEHPKGEPQNPLTDEDATLKFDDCLSHATVDSKTARQIKETILGLEDIDRLAYLTELL